MSNVDLHPLSLPVSRLSPAKSSSSIVDQLAHHQHGKGDSAYSSFSGGSTAPDYSSPFLSDDLQSSSFSHYADLKYVKSIYHPTQVLQSDSKTMDQLYRSVEAISQQYHNNSTANHHNYNESFHINNKALSKQEGLSGNPSQSAHALARPPPVPARLDSFIATKNLENSRVHHQGAESHPQQPQPQPPRTHNRLHSHTGVTLASPKPETANPDASNNSHYRSEPAYSVWRGSQPQLPQPQQPPSYRPPLQPHDQARGPVSPEYLFITDNKAASEQQKSTNTLSRSSQSEHLIPKQPLSGGGCNGDHHSKPSGSSTHFESQRKRAHSAHDWLVSEPTRAASPCNTGQGFISSSIQHKGQFYFVTGVCKLSEHGARTHSLSVCGSGREISTALETQRLREKERCHSTMDNFFRPLQASSRSSSGTITDGSEVFSPASVGKEVFSKSQDQENHRPSLIASRSSRSLEALEETDVTQNREMGRHTANNPIFYCPPQPATPTKDAASLFGNEQQPNHHNKRDDHAKTGKRQPLGDVASERINKETTPLLYHLTGASRAASKLKKDADFSVKGREAALNKTSQGDVAVNDNDGSLQGDISKNDRGEVACNTLDDSFKKYYKEKLKDAQSKVLRETSFKRKDLQLSWPHRIRQKPELRPAVIHSFSSSQDSETSTDTLTPSVASEQTEKGSIKEEVGENLEEANKETEKENGRPANVAQPQVARIGGRKRLTAEQRKMCYSEPEKLHQLGGTPSHSAFRSFGSESESAVDCEVEEESVQQGEQGLVAARRKMFETRGRALSTSSATKTNLKHLQHKALVEYMERKTGQKVVEPQQLTPHVVPPSRQRHSLGEKPFDWGARPLSGNNEGKNMKKKLNRPHSAGRILDSSTSSIRYAQFFSAQSCSGQYVSQQNQSRPRESQGASQGKSASAESLLDQPEPPSFFRNRSTSTPHAFQPHDYEEEPLPVNTMETWSSQKDAEEEASVDPAPEDQQRVRVVAQRGKSMEELGASKLPKLSYSLSKSSEQLDQSWRNSTDPVREAQGKERGRKKQYVLEQTEKEATQGQAQNQTQKKPLLKWNSEPGDATTGTTSRSTSPTSSSSSSRARVQSSPGYHGPVTEEFRSSRPPSETSSNPSSPRGLEISESELKPASSSPVQTKPPCESRPSSRVRGSSSITGPEREQSVDEPSDDALPDSNHEVSLSCGVTTDPSLWILPPEEELKEDVPTSPLVDNVFDECSSSVPPKQAIETSASPCASVSEADVAQQAEEEAKDREAGSEKVGEKHQEVEERGTPEGETESPEKPPDDRPQWEELVEAVVEADQSLARVLYPLANRKTALMLMEQLLSEDTLLMEEHYKKKQEQKGAAESGGETVEGSEPAPCPSASDSQKPQSTDLQSKADITEKKRLLVSYVEERLRSLETTRGALQTEVQENVTRGAALEVLVGERCQPMELERYSLFIGDLERVVSLLLCLSARLARVQNALSTVDQDTDAEEKQSLDSRHRLLCKQREDAKDLKDNLDRRENLVSTFLSRQLSAEQLQDYRRYVQTKASLLIRQKDLEERQRLAEEQLEALSNSLSL